MLSRLYGQAFKTTFGTMKQQIFGSSYYDPYQRDEILKEQQEPQLGADLRSSYGLCQWDEVVKEQQEQEQQEQEQQQGSIAATIRQEKGAAAREERPSIQQRRSLTSMVIDTISTMASELFRSTGASVQTPAAVTATTTPANWQQPRGSPLFHGQDNDFTHYKTSSALEHRMQKIERFIRGIFFQSQQQQQEQHQDSLYDPLAWGLSPVAAENYRLAVEEEASRWGLVDREDLEISFLEPMPPPEPKRTYILFREVPTPPAAPVGEPYHYRRSRTYHHYLYT